MEPIQLTGAKVINTTKMQQSGCLRVIIELNKQDSMSYVGAIAAANMADMLLDATLTPSEIEGENNGFEKSIEKSIERKQPTIYQKFKFKCIEYSGEDYYNRLKRHLGVEKMSDLEKVHSSAGIEQSLKIQINYLFWREQGDEHDIAASKVYGIGYDLWKKLFDEFNNPTK